MEISTIKHNLNSEENKDLISILFVGDIAPSANLEQLMQKSNVIEDFSSIFCSVDYRIGNLETVLVNKGIKILKSGPNLKSNPNIIKALKLANFDLLCLANNHIKDYGDSAIRETIQQLDNYKIAYTGIGNFKEYLKPFIFEIRNIKFGLINCGETEESALSEENYGAFELSEYHVIEKIRWLKQKVDFVIIVIHAGREYIPVPTPRLYKMYINFAKNGADLIVGHHPHVPQGIKLLNKSLIAFSVGNFLFNSSKKLSRKYQLVNMSYMLKVNFSSNEIHSFEVIPFKIDTKKGILRLDKKEFINFEKNYKIMNEVLQDKHAFHNLWIEYYERLSRGNYFSYFVASLINGLSGGNIFRKIKHLFLIILWIIKNWNKSRKDLARAYNYISNPTHYNLFQETIKQKIDNKKCKDKEIKKLLTKWGIK